MKFVYSHMTQTQLGGVFGTSSHKIGQWLKTIRLRDADGKPTEEAHECGFCKMAPSGQCGYHWVWHSEKTVDALKDAGFSVVPNPPRRLVAPAILNGPFAVRETGSSEFAIESSDGSVSVWANSRMTADVVARILNAAHKTGHIDRLCQPQRMLQSPLAPDAQVSSVVTPFEERKEESPPKEATPRHSHNDTLS